MTRKNRSLVLCDYPKCISIHARPYEVGGVVVNLCKLHSKNGFKKEAAELKKERELEGD